MLRRNGPVVKSVESDGVFRIRERGILPPAVKFKWCTVHSCLCPVDVTFEYEFVYFILPITFVVQLRHGDGAGNTVEENSSAVPLIRMR